VAFFRGWSTMVRNALSVVMAGAAGSAVLRSNNALVTDACAAALRASYSAAQRGR
jgi:hypothetical protein